MAHTIEHITGSRFYTIVYDPTLDWDSQINFPGDMMVISIEMAPNAVGDSVIVRDGAGGARIFSHEAIDTYDIAVRYFYGNLKRYTSMQPYIDAAEAIGTFALTFQLA